jgi:Bacterial regulatory helix-turn-helix protein, lysR family
MDRGDLANLTAFVAVADQRSFRAAATRLGVTPSALSHSMQGNVYSTSFGPQSIKSPAR